MIERERWSEAMKARALQEEGDAGEGANGGVIGFDLPPLGSVMLQASEAMEGEEANLMRLVFNEALSDDEELTRRARLLEAVLEKKQGALSGRSVAKVSLLPLYASATPSGRLVANFCACSPFDETEEALASLDALLANPLRENEGV